MERIEKIKIHYNFTSSDAKNLSELRPVMEKEQERFVREFYEYVKNFEDTPKFLKNDEIVRKHQDAIGKWFMAMFSGEYGTQYFHMLERVGEAHVKINLNAHYVNASMHFVKRFAFDILRSAVTDPKELIYISHSVEKILDINLDIFTSSYIEEEKKELFLSYKIESFLVEFSKRFSYGLNLILVIGLVIMGLLVIGLFIYDLTHIYHGEIERGILSTLGSLLMLWVVIELMDTEIDHLRGGKFAVKVFISVALVAVIRKILVTSLSSEAVDTQITLVAALAVLGGVYWLIARLDK
ncbi:MAG: protoglobin domain-containing protein [Deltaproteobacteria bacterium]|nr:protoglobin domain-containing protein [Deltaproteobacteria bacterium]